MLEKTGKKHICKVDRVVDIIGRRWNLMIIWHLRDETLRFSELQTLMCGINSKTITRHLRDLEKHAIITRRVFPEVPPRVEYTLTGQGKAVLPIIEAMMIWGDTYLYQGEMTECRTGEKEGIPVP